MNRRQFNNLMIGGAVASLGKAPVSISTKVTKVILIGAGIMGASIAYHLSQRGAVVTILERATPASGATANSFAWLNSTFSKSPRSYYELNLQGIAGWRRLQHELRGQLQVQWGGSAEWYPVGADADNLRRDVRRHQSWGYSTRLIDEGELRRLLPAIKSGPVAAASFSDQEGAVDPVHATNVILRNAQRMGTKLISDCAVTGMSTSGGRIQTVKTSKGNFQADVVVLAAGTGTPAIAAMVGVNVPMKDAPGVLVHLPPQRLLLDKIALAPGAHIKQKLDGRIVTGSDFGGTPITDASRQTGLRLLKSAVEFLPQLKSNQIERVTLGWRVMPQDELPVVGFAVNCPNLYLAAMHSGITLSPLIGQLATTEILDDIKVEILSAYRAERFK